MEDFAKLGLKKDIVDVLRMQKFTKPTQVQAEIIPLALKGKNIVFTAKTGSGKTLAYLLPNLSKINKKQGLQMLVLVPTRELCIQVSKEMKKICDVLQINVGALYGGREIALDYLTTSKKNQIIVGTPGRLIEHINSKKVLVGDVRYLVFDEADQMFDHGFYEDCRYVLARVSRISQIIFSSATTTQKVKQFIEYELPEHESLTIGALIPKNILQEKMFSKISHKNNILLHILKKRNFKRTIIFCNTKLKCVDVADFLSENKFLAKAMTSDLHQDDRLNFLNLFKEGKIRILVATDVAARGLHINNLDAVINYDVPNKDEFYVHRIGRTGRAEHKGYALTLICPEDEERFERIEFEFNLKINLIEEQK